MDRTTDFDASLAKLISPYVDRTGGLISALRAVQSEFGFLPPETDAIAADLFNLSRAEVNGVISFYTDFRRRPAGRAIIRLCAAEACQAQGGRALERSLSKRFALAPGKTSASGDLTLDRVYCLGLCTVGPAAMVNDRLIARASCDKVAAVIDATSLDEK